MTSQYPLPTSLRRRQQPSQPPSLQTAALGNSHVSNHGLGLNVPTPLSTTSLSSPFSAMSPSGAMMGTSPMAPRTTASFNAAYNPQQWGPLSGGSPNATRTILGRARQAGQTPRLAPRHIGPDEPVASPPPPYSPRRDETIESGQHTVIDVASPADTTSPDSNPSRYSTPVSAATTISPDFAPRNCRRSPLQPSQFSASDGSIITQDTAFPPPPPTSKSSNRSQSTSKSHADWLISSLRSRNRAASTASPAAAIDTLQQNTAQAIAGSPITIHNGNPTPTPPAARRAASTGFIGTHSRSPPSVHHSPSQPPWEPGMPLPPPPPGPPPPSVRSQSLHRPPVSSSSSFDSPASTGPRQRREPGLVSTLGPVPPTPADWNDGEEQSRQETWRGRSNGPSQLHIDTGSILRNEFRERTDQSSTAPDTSRQCPSSHVGRDSSVGALARSPAIRNRSAKGIRERRSESRNGKSRAIEDSSHDVPSNPTTWASSPQNVRPTDLILPSHGTLSKRRTDTKTPQSGKYIISLDGALSGSEAGTSATPQLQLGSEASSLSTLPKSPSCSRTVGLCASSPDSDTSAKPAAMSDAHITADREHSTPSTLRNPSAERPISHLLHIPNLESSVQAPLLPYNSPTKEVEGDLLGPESPHAFAQRANERHRIFTEREAATTDKSEKLDLFLQFVLAESKIRREQHRSMFKNEDIDVEKLMRTILDRDQAIGRSQDLQLARPATKSKETQSMHASSASESSIQGSLWQAESTVSSQKQESPITVSSDNSPHVGPESSWWKDYVPCLSPIASMSIVTGQDEMDSRGRAPSRWWEDRSGESKHGDAFNVLGRSKRESKYMGVSKEARDSPAFFGSSIAGASNHDQLQGNVLPDHEAYGPHEYPLEKVGWHEEVSSFSRTTAHISTPRSAPYTPDPKKLDVSRLVTLPPPYPRHYPAVNNSHPDLSDEREVVRSLHDLSDATSMRKAYEMKITEKRQRAESWCKHQRSLHEQDMQFQIEHGEMSHEEFDHAETEIERKILQSEKEIVQADFDLFQSTIVSPLHDLFSKRIDRANSSLDKLSNHLFSDAQHQSPNLPQEEGDEHAELLEKLTQLKWLFEARESLHRETFNLLSERNDKYRAIVLLPYQQTKSQDKLAEVESFFAQDARDRRLAFEQAAASRSEAFLAVIENNVIRGVELQLSAFWDIAPSLLHILQRIPPALENFEIQIPAAEYADNPSFYPHPMQYLYSLLTHAEKSSYQFIESQINLLCLLHEIRSLALAARYKAEQSNAGEEGPPEKMAVGREMEERALMDDLKEKVAVVEGQWVEGLGSRIGAERGKIRVWLEDTGGWDDDADWA